MRIDFLPASRFFDEIADQLGPPAARQQRRLVVVASPNSSR